jgi:hypothetical protein
MPKTGELWIASKKRRAIEMGLITVTSPGIVLAGLVAAGALKLEDSSAQVVTEVERSLYPGQTFTMRKLGDPHRETRVARACRKAMIDEIPQFAAIRAGKMALFGPRADEPEHVQNTFLTLSRINPGLHDRTLLAHRGQLAGIVSSYAILSHAHNLEAQTESERFPEGEALDENVLVRGSCDSHDFEHASPRYEAALLVQAFRMVRSNYAHYMQTAIA